MSDRRPLTAHLRAAALLGVCVVAVIASLPMPGPSSRKALKDPAGQQELAIWVDLLGNVGWHTDKDTLADQVMWLARNSRRARNAVVDPFKPFFRITGTYQGWGLFAYPDTHPHALIVEVERGDDTWEPLYHADEREHDWRAGLLHFRRVRAMYNPGRKAPGTYTEVVDFLAAEIFATHPDVDRVRIRFERGHTVLPWEPPPDEPPKTRFRRIRRRPAEEGA